MYKAFANTTIFTTTYLIFILPTYYFTNPSNIENGLVISIFSLPFMLYVLSMVVIWGICFIRGAMIGKRWLVAIPTVAFVFNLTPSLSMIPFVPYVYHFLALTLGVVCPLLTVSTPDTLMKYGG
jgi:hypothetical protein